ncbi:FKBP-type peptidyl-prolyl cis-trans isomerase [Vibrio mimicus CAIM 602]|nr:FKBP-type peptidyl-prolyl cis-trans isomerase [Vibrio mimicus CAIM 602]
MNPIAPNSAVTLHFTIKLKDGSLADSTHNQGKPAKLVMGDGSLSPNFEQCLLGMLPGEKKLVSLAAQDAFGAPNPDHIHYMDRSKFIGGDLELEVGTIMAFSGQMVWKFRASLLKLPAILSRSTLTILSQVKTSPLMLRSCLLSDFPYNSQP